MGIFDFLTGKNSNQVAAAPTPAAPTVVYVNGQKVSTYPTVPGLKKIEPMPQAFAAPAAPAPIRGGKKKNIKGKNDNNNKKKKKTSKK